MRIDSSTERPPVSGQAQPSQRSGFTKLLDMRRDAAAEVGDGQAFGFGEFGMFGRFSAIEAPPLPEPSQPSQPAPVSDAKTPVHNLASAPDVGSGKGSETRTVAVDKSVGLSRQFERPSPPFSTGETVKAMELAPSGIETRVAAHRKTSPDATARLALSLRQLLPTKTSDAAPHLVRVVEAEDGRVLVTVSGPAFSQPMIERFRQAAQLRLAARGLVLDRVIWTERHRYATPPSGVESRGAT